MEVRKAYPDEFERIYPLLKIHDRRLSRDAWHRLFKSRWPAPFDHYGYLLMDGSECVGFIGTIFSRRRLGGQEYGYCNISTWVVREDFRNQSLSLLFPILKLKDWVITDMTPSREVSLILKRLGFLELDGGFKLLPPFVQKSSRNCEILMNPVEIARYLVPYERQILDDHLPFGSYPLLLLTPQGCCYLIATRVKKKKIPLVRLDYIGNHRILRDNLGGVVNALAIRCYAVAVMVDDRFLPHGHCLRAFAHRFKQPRLYRGFGGDRRELDNLYSELAILGI